MQMFAPLAKGNMRISIHPLSITVYPKRGRLGREGGNTVVQFSTVQFLQREMFGACSMAHGGIDY